MYVQAACLRGDRPKAIAVVCKRLSNSPSTRKDIITTLLMKSIPLSILVIVAGGLPGFSQSAEPASSREFPTPAARTFIQHTLEVPAFVPPEPPVEKPIPAMRVDAAVTVPTKSGRTLTILRGEASDLPDIPEPVIVPQRPPRQFTPEDLARHADQRRLLINFSAEVYENGVSILRWTHPDTAEPYQAICGFDVNLLSGIGRFVSDGRTYQLSFTPPGVRPITRHRLSKLPVLVPP